MTVEAWALAEVKNALERLTDQGGGEPVPFDHIREEVGIGHDDLRDVLTELRERGDATEEAPGEWVNATGAGGSDDGAVEESGVSLSEAEARARAAMDREDRKGRTAPPRPQRGTVPPSSAVLESDGATTRLTVGVADALDEQTLGKLVKAGIEEAKAAGVMYTLQVDAPGDAA